MVEWRDCDGFSFLFSDGKNSALLNATLRTEGGPNFSLSLPTRKGGGLFIPPAGMFM